MFDAPRTSHPDGVEAVLDLVNGSDLIRRDAEILKSGGGLVSTRYAAEEGWFAERQITAFNIATLTNPLSSPRGLTKVAHMLAEGTITARIHSIVQPDQIGEMLEKLRTGGLHGKVVIRFYRYSASQAGYATLYWNNSLTRLWQEERCRSRFSEPAKSARH